MGTYFSLRGEELNPYQKLIQYWTTMFARPGAIRILDHMNFNADIFSPALRLSDIESLVTIEPGYGSPDGSIEVGPLIRNLELSRLNVSRPDRLAVNDRLCSEAGVGAGNGCTNVMNGIFNAILRLPTSLFPRQNERPEIILVLPNYSVYLSQLHHLDRLVTTRFVDADRGNGFLPTFEDIVACSNSRTVAVVVTYPNNPAQSSYEGEAAAELARLVDFCQGNGIFLIVDNVYQDLMFGDTDGGFAGRRRHEEIFSFTDSTDFVIKLFGPSKDSVFFPGYRFGYWFGDRRIETTYRKYISATENSLNSLGLILGAWDMFFRAARLSGKEIEAEDMELFDTGLFGWGRTFDAGKVYELTLERGLHEQYCRRSDESLAIMAAANRATIEMVESSDVFDDYVNDQIGNVFFISVSPTYFSGDDDTFFESMLEAGFGMLPGTAFGLPSSSDETWFRITLIHETRAQILRDLEGVESALKRRPQAALSA